MNSRMKKLISGAKVRFRLPHLLALGLLALGLAGWPIVRDVSKPAKLAMPHAPRE